MMSVWVHNETGHLMKARYKGGLLIPADARSNKPLWFYSTKPEEWDWFDYV